ncbi:glycosyltransferase family 4 protein [Accumulibacter sp.]|uniref:Glycosyl transferase group 1 n=1 Tax=Accumulibacter regalis TaxID=522306 RepID=C7RIY2_ACCRE|nr:glycosyltransferase family 4 protein [Accumulibacter sp.]
MAIKVLYIDGEGAFGGSSRSLFEAVKAFPEGAVLPYFLATRGTALDFYKQLAVDIITTRGMPRFDNTRYGYYRGVRWLILLRELFYFPFVIVALVRARLRWKDIDLVHVNEFVYVLPGLIGKWLFHVPLVVHVRALARFGDGSIRTRVLNSMFSRYVDSVVAIDGNVRATIPSDWPVTVINNSFTPGLASSPEKPLVDKLGSLPSGSFKVGFVGNLHRSKGVFEIVDAAKLIKTSGREVDFLMVGGVTMDDVGLKAWVLSKMGFAQNVRADLARRVDQEGLGGFFHFLGPTLNIKYVYDRLDVLLFPSHFDAPGRPVFEAGFSGVPSIVAVKKPMPDTFIPGETGLAVSGRCPAELAKAILYLEANRSEQKRMGSNARRLAEENFDPCKNSKRLLGVYHGIVGGKSSAQILRKRG